MITHLSTSIKGLLEKSDDLLQVFFETNPAELRAALKEKLANGENFIGSPECDGFDPITGKCPGHAPKPILPIKAAIAISHLEKKKSEVRLYTDYAYGVRAGYEDAIKIIRELYKPEMEVTNA